jgi:hypothetical protein
VNQIREIVGIAAILVALLSGYLLGHAEGSRRRPPS